MRSVRAFPILTHARRRVKRISSTGRGFVLHVSPTGEIVPDPRPVFSADWPGLRQLSDELRATTESGMSHSAGDPGGIVPRRPLFRARGREGHGRVTRQFPQPAHLALRKDGARNRCQGGPNPVGGRDSSHSMKLAAAGRMPAAGAFSCLCPGPAFPTACLRGSCGTGLFFKISGLAGSPTFVAGRGVFDSLPGLSARVSGSRWTQWTEWTRWTHGTSRN